MMTIDEKKKKKMWGGGQVNLKNISIALCKTIVVHNTYVVNQLIVKIQKKKTTSGKKRLCIFGIINKLNDYRIITENTIYVI